MQQLDELVAITKVLRDSALLELNNHIALETIQERNLADLDARVHHEIQLRSETKTGLDSTVDAAWSAWVRRERAGILREIARIRALKLETEGRAKIALAKFSATEDLRSGAAVQRNARRQKRRDENLEQLSMLHKMASRTPSG